MNFNLQTNKWFFFIGTLIDYRESETILKFGKQDIDMTRMMN